MENSIKKEKLRFIILPTRFCPQEYQDIYNQAYLSWKTIWSQTFKEEMLLNEELFF